MQKNSPTYSEVEQASNEHHLDIHTMRRFTLERNIVKSNGNILLVIGFSSIHFEDIPRAVERVRKVIYD